MSYTITDVDRHSSFYAPSVSKAFELAQPEGDPSFACFPLLTETEQAQLAQIPSKQILGFTWQGTTVQQLQNTKNKFLFEHALHRPSGILFAEHLSRSHAVANVVLPILKNIALRLEQETGEPILHVALRYWDPQMYTQSTENASSWHRDYIEPPLYRRRVLVTLFGETTHCLVLQTERDKQKTADLFGRLNQETSHEREDLDQIVQTLLRSQAEIVRPSYGQGLVFFAGRTGAIHRIPPPVSPDSKRIVAIFDFAVRSYEEHKPSAADPILDIQFDLKKLEEEIINYMAS